MNIPIKERISSSSSTEISKDSEIKNIQTNNLIIQNQNTTLRIDLTAPSNHVQETYSYIPPRTVIDMLAEASTTRINQLALSYAIHEKINGGDGEISDNKHGSEKTISWKQYKDQAWTFAKGLISIGVKKSDGVLISASNSASTWFTNVGSIVAGAVVSHVRMDAGKEQFLYLAQDLKASVFILENYEMLMNILPIFQILGNTIRTIIILNQEAQEFPFIMDLPVYTLEHFQSINAKLGEDIIHDRILSIRPQDYCIVCYQYSTQGKIEGVALTHDNVYFTAVALTSELGPLTTNDTMVGYLPLYHSFSQIIEIYVPMVSGLSLYFFDTKIESFGYILQRVRPTIFFATPATFNQISIKIFSEKEKIPKWKTPLYKWAKKRAISNSRKKQYGNIAYRSLGHVVANMIIWKSIKKNLGLDKCRACYAVLAPIDLHVLELFNAVDIPIYQLQGINETTGCATINAPHAWTFGSFGKPLTGSELYVNPINREVLYRGRNIFSGYWKNEEGTKRVIDKEGWYHSSQLGHLNPDGFLLVTEHSKDYVILSTGDLVPPYPLEKQLIETIKEFDRVLVIGDSRSFLSVLLVLSTREGSNGKLSEVGLSRSRELGSKATKVKEVIKCPHWAIWLDSVLERINSTVTLPSHQLRKWLIVSDDFFQTGEEIQSNGLPNRGYIQRKYRSVIDSLYS